MADATERGDLRIRARVVLAEALIHSLRGHDEEGVLALVEADEIALRDGDRTSVAQARAELGYVDFLRARYDRASMRLSDACGFADGSVSILAKATTYLGCVESDRADYPRAIALLQQAGELARVSGDVRTQAVGLSMLGRISLLCGNLDHASDSLRASIVLAETDHWLAYLPWPQALLGEVQLARGDAAGAEELLRQAFARACQLGDPCWEGVAARGLALVSASSGDLARAFDVLADARVRCNRLADPYVWLDAYILDAQCELGLRHGHADAGRWVDALHRLASRSGMRELTVRAVLHRARTGHEGDAAAALLLAADIDNPALQELVSPPDGSTPLR